MDDERRSERPESAYEGRTQPSTEHLPGDLPDDRLTRGPATGVGGGSTEPPGASDATREERKREGGGAPGQRS